MPKHVQGRSSALADVGGASTSSAEPGRTELHQSADWPLTRAAVILRSTCESGSKQAESGRARDTEIRKRQRDRERERQRKREREFRIEKHIKNTRSCWRELRLAGGAVNSLSGAGANPLLGFRLPHLIH